MLMPDHAWIAAHIPHQGSMCLLDRVLAWDARHIVCAASSHRDPDHPLRAHGRLGASCGIEYAAQAMAVHGALLAGEDAARPAVGYLVSARGVQCEVERLDDVAGELSVQASCVMSNGNNILYEFSVSAGPRRLLAGRAAGGMDAAGLPAA